MPFNIEKDGQTIEVWTKAEVEAEVAGLKAVNAQLKDEKRQELEAKRKIEAEKLQLEEESARQNGDLKRLAEIAQQRADEQAAQLTKLQGQIASERITNAVNELVGKIGAGGQHNEDLRDLLRARYDFKYDSASNEVIAAGASGERSISALMTDIQQDQRYAGYLAGSGAKGAGASGSGAGASLSKKPNEMTEMERLQLKQSNPDLFKQLFLN